MQYRALCTLALLFLVAPACERNNPPNDASILPLDDGGSATDGGAPADARADARTSRPGAGPLDPDLTIDCDEISLTITKNLETGNIIGRSGYVSASWDERDLPTCAWTCLPEPAPFLSCGTQTSDRCELLGPRLSFRCINTTWYVAPDGGHFAYCGYFAESDVDEDGVFEPSYPFDYRDAYLAIIR